MTKPKPFTDTWLQSLVKRPPAERVDYTEIGHRGFMLRHSPTGTLTFVHRYQVNGKVLIATIGQYPSTTLLQAHERHATHRRWLGKGIDPKAEEERLTAEALAAAAAAEMKRAGKVTVRNLIAEWAWHHARRHRKRPLVALRILKDALCVPSLAGKELATVTKRDLVVVVDKPLNRGSLAMANRLNALVRQAFQFAAERDLIATNPASGLRKRPGGHEETDGRALDRDEVRLVWQRLSDPLPVRTRGVRLALKLILATCQRPIEVVGARWSEFDTVVNRMWTIPPARIKTQKKRGKTPHTVPITGLMLELLEEVREEIRRERRTDGIDVDRTDTPVLFPARPHARTKPGNRGLSRRRDSLAKYLRDLWVHIDPENPDADTATIWGIPAFAPNDLRRTGATHMGANGIDRFHQDKVLNHSDGTIGGKYDKWNYWPEKQHALETWHAELRSIIAGEEKRRVSNVLPFPAQAAAVTPN